MSKIHKFEHIFARSSSKKDDSHTFFFFFITLSIIQLQITIVKIIEKQNNDRYHLCVELIFTLYFEFSDD